MNYRNRTNEDEIRTARERIRRRLLGWASGAAAFGIAFALVALSDSSLGQSAPGVGISLTGTNEVTLSITTGITNLSYEVYFQQAVADTNWTLIASGADATNLTAATDQTAAGFFKILFLAADANDVDGDGVVNWQDAQPFNPAIGILSVTIDSPLNGADLH